MRRSRRAGAHAPGSSRAARRLRRGGVGRRARRAPRRGRRKRGTGADSALERKLEAPRRSRSRSPSSARTRPRSRRSPASAVTGSLPRRCGRGCGARGGRRAALRSSRRGQPRQSAKTTTGSRGPARAREPRPRLPERPLASIREPLATARATPSSSPLPRGRSPRPGTSSSSASRATSTRSPFTGSGSQRRGRRGRLPGRLRPRLHPPRHAARRRGDPAWIAQLTRRLCLDATARATREQPAARPSGRERNTIAGGDRRGVRCPRGVGGAARAIARRCSTASSRATRATARSRASSSSPPGTIASRIARCLDKLRDELEGRNERSQSRLGSDEPRSTKRGWASSCGVLQPAPEGWVQAAQELPGARRRARRASSRAPRRTPSSAGARRRSRGRARPAGVEPEPRLARRAPERLAAA